jgi:hypothetical protein
MKRSMKLYTAVYDNDIDALIPEKWALEGIMLLEENMVLGNLVNRDFKNEIMDYGKTVNVDMPGSFSAKRKGVNDDVTVQNANASTIPVVLNQHLHTSFMLKDAQMSMSFKDLVEYFLKPAMISIASGADKAISGFIPMFLSNSVGQLDGMTGSNAVAQVLQARKNQNDLKIALPGRKAVITTATEATLLGLELFTAADKVGDAGTALREASLGRKLGYDFFMGQNTPYVQTGLTQNRTGATTAGHAAGVTSIALDGFNAAIIAGSFVTIGGSMYPYRVVSTTGGSTPSAMVIGTALKAAVLNDAVVTVYTPVTVDRAATYPAEHVKDVHIDGYTITPQVGQILADSAGNIYTIMEVSGDTGTECDVMLNRPLVAALADDAVLGVGPGGSYNFMFVKDALALVNRPLALPRAGALASVQNYNNMSLRVTITYDGKAQGHLVTIDTLMGVAVLDVNRGTVLLG